MFDGLLARSPALAARLGGAPPASAVRGAGPLWQVVPRARRGRVLLVGDAAGYVDALTGDGVALGLATAAAAVEAIAADRPWRYDAAHRRLTRAYRIGTRALLVATRARWTRWLVLRGLAAAPWVFDRALEHLGRVEALPMLDNGEAALAFGLNNDGVGVGMGNSRPGGPFLPVRGSRRWSRRG